MSKKIGFNIKDVEIRVVWTGRYNKPIKRTRYKYIPTGKVFYTIPDLHRHLLGL